MEKASRNDPCPCGSGKKFKKCCDGLKKIRIFDSIFPYEDVSKIRGLSTELFQRAAVNLFPRSEKIKETEKNLSNGL